MVSFSRFFLLGIFFLIMVSFDVMAAVTSGNSNHKQKAITIDNLSAAWASAYSTNPELLAKVKEQHTLTAGVSRAYSGLRPSITVNLDAERRHVDQTIRSTPETKGSKTSSIITPSITISQSIFQFGKSIDEIDAAKEQAYAGWGSYFDLENSILVKAAKAYLETKANKDIISINERTLNFSRQVLKSVKVQAEVGEKTYTDVDQALARVEESKAGLSTSKAKYKSSVAEFIKVIGAKPSAQLKEATWNYESMIPKNLSSFIQDAQRNNPKVVSARHNERAAGKSFYATAKALTPSLTATGTIQKNYEDWIGSSGTLFASSTNPSETNTFSGKLTLSIPLYQGGAIHADTRKAYHTFKKARLERINAELSVKEAATKLWENLQALKEKINFIKSQIKFLKRSLDGTKKEANLGAKTILDVLSVEDKLLKARIELVNAEKDYKLTIFEIQALLGKLTHDRLKIKVVPHGIKTAYNRDYRKFFGIG